MYGCVHDGDGEPATDGTDIEMPVEPMSEIERAQTAAAAALTAADIAAAAAKTASEAAATATADRATIQTAANSAVPAAAAAKAAADAAAAAAAAKTASELAAAATDVTSAVEARVAAVAAQTKAEEARTAAEEALAHAMTAGDGEVQIVEKTKSVGKTSVTINDLTLDDAATGQTTGLQAGLKITDTGGGVEGDEEVPADANASPPVALKAATPAVTARPIDIGVTYDSVEDSARLTLVTHYLDSQAASAFEDASGGTPVMGTRRKHSGPGCQR